MAVLGSAPYHSRETTNVLWDGNLFRLDKNQKYPLGMEVQYGVRKFRYAHFGADTNRGVLISQDFSESSVVDTDNKIIAPASANDVTDGTIGSRFMQITLASVTVDQFAGGTFHTTDDVGEGYTYTIKGNNATGDPATNDFRLEIYEPLKVAVDNTTDFAIFGHPFSNLEIATAATDIATVGVTVNTMDVSAEAFGFVQTWGPASILTDGTIALGDQVSISDTVAGAVQAAGGGGTSVSDLIAEAIVGYCLIDGDTGAHSVIMLQV